MKRFAVLVTLIVVTLFGVTMFAQKPVAELPRVYIDSTYNQPTAGTTWAAHTSAQFTNALTSSSPGDVIVLDAGTTYTGNFNLPAKSNSNGQWIYIVSSQLANLPEGKRVSPPDAANMPKVVTPNTAAAIEFASSSNHWRLAGLEIYSASTEGCVPTYLPVPINCFTYTLVGVSNTTAVEPDSFTIDRSYIHGTPTIDMQHAITGNVGTLAVVDSYIDDIHLYGAEAQGIIVYYSPGPVKIVNNFISAATENILFGGAGGPNNPYVASDVEVRNNYLFKPLSWVGDPSKVIKNHFEVKSGQRFLVDGNTMENVWLNGQNGFSVVLTVRSAQSGDVTVVNDITFTNNILKNVAAGFNTIAKDDGCGTTSYPNCHNAGSQTRWYIVNNLVTFRDPSLPGGIRNVGIQFNGGRDRITGDSAYIKDVVFQHNTFVPPAWGCWNAVFFSDAPPIPVVTQNVWLLDNVFCRQPTGDNGWQGIMGIAIYMGQPSTPPYDVLQRFEGNVMYVPSTDEVQIWLASNLATATNFTFDSNSQLVTPNYAASTTDGNQAGYSFTGPVTPLSYNSPVSLSSGTQGIPYTPITTLATGGAPPYTFSLQSRAWPTGMTLDASTGVISGTPTASGTFTPNIAVVDSAEPPSCPFCGAPFL
jgi:Putative Ig domain